MKIYTTQQLEMF